MNDKGTACCEKSDRAKAVKSPCCSADKTVGGSNDVVQSQTGHDHGHHHGHDTTMLLPTCCDTLTVSSDAAATAGSVDVCFAVIGENGSDVVVFDASGNPKTFTYDGDDVQKLCFQACGVDATKQHHLTPCFDAQGNHCDNDNTLQDNCSFCVLDKPHLHAHLRDPDICGREESKMEHEILTQTLLPIDENEPLLKISVSDRMPKECNSHQQTILRKENINKQKSVSFSKRLHTVQHEDHQDYLVLNQKTGQLHLMHPCNDCGSEDIHGSFRHVGKRSLLADRQILFFDVAPRPFNLWEHLSQFFEPHSDRVAAVENMMMHEVNSVSSRQKTSSERSFDAKTKGPSKSNDADNTDDFAQPAPIRIVLTADAIETASNTVKSKLICMGICCSSEIPMVHSVLDPLPGVKGVQINVSLKHVMVEHDPDVVTATGLEKSLNDDGFGATILRDGGAAKAAAQAMAGAKNGSGRSQFYVDHICCASEIPAIMMILEPLDGVKSVSINVTNKFVYVDHIFAVISAQVIVNALNNESFGAEIRMDAAKAARQSGTLFVESVMDLKSNASIDTLAVSDAITGTFGASQVEWFEIDVVKGTLTVAHSPLILSAEAIADELREQTGMTLVLSRDGADPSHWTFPSFDNDDGGIEKDEGITFPKINVLLSGICWIISMLHYIGGNWKYLKYVGLLAVVFGLPTIAMKAFRTMMRYQFDANCLMLFASLGAIALQEYPEAAAIVFLFSISEWLEVRATSRARHALSSIVQLRPDKANIVHPSTKEIIVIPAASVPVGSLVSVKTGDKIPCDGVVVEGQSTVNESSLTGESRPVKKGPGDDVFGGTVNSGHTHLMVRTTSTADNSAVAKLIRLVEEAQSNRSETEKLVDTFAKYYTPVIVLAAIFMVSVPWAFGTEVGRAWTKNGLVFIVVACPCALIISTPVSYVAGLAATAQKGVLIKGGATLEALGFVKYIMFDKTGTLTCGDFALVDLKVIGNSKSRVEVFELLSLMESRASHPIGQAVVQAAQNEKVSIPKGMILEDHTIIAGEGLKGLINGLEVHVGNERLFTRLGLLDAVPESYQDTVSSWKATGGTVGFMSIQGEGIVCAFCATDRVRPEASKVIASLKSRGIETFMLTGDNHDAACSIGTQIGLVPEEILSRLLPEEKLKHVTSVSGGITNLSVLKNPCSTKHLVLMCGDGVNDAPALAAADIGVAMGAGAALALETADVTLLDSNLEKLEYCIEMGRRVMTKIKQNVLFSLVVKFTVLGFALAGKTNLWAAIGSDVGSMLLVTLNSMMLLPARQRRSDVALLKDDIERGHGDDKSSEHDDHGKNHSHDHGDSEKVKAASSGCNFHQHDHGHSHAHGCSHTAHSVDNSPPSKHVDSNKGTRKATPSACHSSSHGHSHAHEHHDNAKDQKASLCGGGHAHSHDHDACDKVKAPSTCGNNHKHGHTHAHDHKHSEVAQVIGSSHSVHTAGSGRSDSVKPIDSYKGTDKAAAPACHSSSHGHSYSHEHNVSHDNGKDPKASLCGGGHAHSHDHNVSDKVKAASSCCSSHKHGHAHTHDHKDSEVAKVASFGTSHSVRTADTNEATASACKSSSHGHSHVGEHDISQTNAKDGKASLCGEGHAHSHEHDNSDKVMAAASGCSSHTHNHGHGGHGAHHDYEIDQDSSCGDHGHSHSHKHNDSSKATSNVVPSSGDSSSHCHSHALDHDSSHEIVKGDK